MAHIGILVHEHDRFAEESYYLRYIAEVWKEMGLEVSLYKGLPDSVRADLVVLHVDQCIIPLDYLAFARALPHAVNTVTGDFSKNKISPNLLQRADLFGGRVIIKTNTKGGYKEAHLAATKSLVGRLLNGNIPWGRNAGTMESYPLLKSTAKIPDSVWNNPDLVVEKFLPERQGELYGLRTWVFLGDQDVHEIGFADGPMIKPDEVVRREDLGAVPPELRKVREELGLEFGRFHYALHKGEVVLFDVDPTPTVGDLPLESFMPGIQRLAEGIQTLLPRGRTKTTQRPVSQPRPAPDTAAVPVTQPKKSTPAPLAPAPAGHAAAPASAASWRQFGPPLRPSTDDIKFVTAEVQKLLKPRALILGVTPELCELHWPMGTELDAADHSPQMIETLWPGPADKVTCAEWTALPFEDGSRDVVVCDGGWPMLSYPDGQRAFVEEMRRILSPEGLCILRLFVPPANTEDTVAVIADLVQGKIPNVNLLILRLAMAMQEDPAEGIALSDLWEKLNRETGPWENLAALIKWPLEHLTAVDGFRDSTDRFYFTDARMVKSMFGQDPGGFEHVESHVPLYMLGDRCPTIVFRRSG